MTYTKIFRDDDISHTTDIALFKRVHNYFKEAIVLHTIALICKDIETNPDLIEYIKSQNIDVQVHCWTHYDMTTDYEQVKEDLQKCIVTIKAVFGERPTTLFPPWNRTDETVNQIAGSLGLKVSNKKISLDQYIRFNGEVSEEVINFHYWAQQESILLEPALEIYNKKRG
jgi:peptidoglycan/xylan/chitin deacetylase (PgdA/CDA1 family)